MSSPYGTYHIQKVREYALNGQRLSMVKQFDCFHFDTSLGLTVHTLSLLENELDNDYLMKYFDRCQQGLA